MTPQKLKLLSDHPNNIGPTSDNMETKTKHDCNHTADFNRLYRWQEDHDKAEAVKNEQLKEGQEILKDIQETVNRLDKNQVATEVQNGYQDKQIEGINQKERESIRNKWVIIGLVVGSFVGPILIRVIEFYTPL